MKNQLKPFAESIGEMCNEWAHLEQWVNRLFLAVGQWDYRLRNALTMSSIIGIRDQIEATKVGAINRCADGPFLDAVIDSLNYIDSELRPMRNAFVHHIWAPADDGIRAIKVDVTARQAKEPTTNARTVRPYENKSIAIEEVREVVSDIINERIFLGQLVRCFMADKADEVDKLIQLLEPPLRLHRNRQREKQSQMDKIRSKQ